MITLTLAGRPISVNHYKKPSITPGGKSYMYVPKEVKQMIDFWQIQAKAQMQKQGAKMIEGEVSMEVEYFFENKARRDIDNYLKVYFDLLSGIAYADDKQIRFLKVTKSYDGLRPRTEFIIK